MGEEDIEEGDKGYGVDKVLLGCFHELSSSSSKGSVGYEEVGGIHGDGKSSGDFDGEGCWEVIGIAGGGDSEGDVGEVSEGVDSEGVVGVARGRDSRGSSFGEDRGRDSWVSNFGEEVGDEKGKEDDCGSGSAGGGGSGRKKRKSQAKIASRLKKGWKAVKKGALKTGNGGGKAGGEGGGDERNQIAWEDKQAKLTEIWVNSVLPQWKKKRRSAKVRSLVFCGIPPSVRGKVWMAALGNGLNVNKDLFNVLKESAVVGRELYLKERMTVEQADGDIGAKGGDAEVLMTLQRKERSAHKAITLDLPRTFPHLAFFHAEGSNYRESLQEILEAFAYLRPGVGYSQGMSFLVAVLLLYMPPEDAFKCFVNMMHKSCFLHFFRMKMPEVRIYLQVHTRLMAQHLPHLHCHFSALSVEPELYMINWVMSLYCHALPLELTSRIWDLFVLDGDVAVFRTAIGLLKYFSARMLKMSFEEIAYLLNHLSEENIDADRLMKEVRSIQGVTRKHFKELYRDQEKKMQTRCGVEASPVLHNSGKTVLKQK